MSARAALRAARRLPSVARGLTAGNAFLIQIFARISRIRANESRLLQFVAVRGRNALFASIHEIRGKDV